MRFIIGLGLTVLLASCATTMTNYYTQTVQSWRGGNINTLLQHWGKPDNVIASNGNRIYVFNTSNSRNYNTPTGPNVGVNFAPGGKAVMTSSPNINNAWTRGPMSLTCSAIFVVNPKGVVIDTQISGNSCYGGESFRGRMSNPAASHEL